MSNEDDKTRAVDGDSLADIRRAARERRESSDDIPATQPQSAPPAMPQPATGVEQPDGVEPVVSQPQTHGNPGHRPPNDEPPTQGRIAAYDFVRTRDDELDELIEPMPDSARRRSSLPLFLAVVAGFWIIAAGVFVALRSVGGSEDDSEEDFALVIDGSDALATPEPIPTFAPTATPDPNATPTPVPPTPEWVPETGGPRSPPFTFIVEATVEKPDFYDSQNGNRIEPTAAGYPLPLTNPTASGAPLVLRVVVGEPTSEWAAVELVGTAGEVAWVKSSQFFWSSSNRIIQIDVQNNVLRLFEGNEVIYQAPVTTGARTNVTPNVTTYVLENAGQFGSVEGTELMRLAAFGAVGTDLDGLPTLSIGITDDPDVIGSYSTDGDVLVDRGAAEELRQLIVPGSVVEILGTPPPPTPTPEPTATVDTDLLAPPSGGAGGGFTPCPNDAFGSFPNCYRIIDRLTIEGECGSSEQKLDGDCVLLGGSPNFQPDGTPVCEGAASTRIGDFCYLVVGPVPRIPGDCPPETNEVNSECRIPA